MSRITPEKWLFAFAKSIGRSPESWLAMQDNHDLWLARQHVNLKGVAKLERARPPSHGEQGPHCTCSSLSRRKAALADHRPASIERARAMPEACDGAVGMVRLS